jgi:hypothetical protein
MSVYSGDCILHKNECGGLQQNSTGNDYNTCHRSDLQSQFCRADIKKTVNNKGTKLYSKLPNHIKYPENIQLFRDKLSFCFATEVQFCRGMFVV